MEQTLKDAFANVINDIAVYSKRRLKFNKTKDRVYSSLMAIEDEMSKTGASFDPGELNEVLESIETVDERDEALVNGARHVLNEVRKKWQKDRRTR